MREEVAAIVANPSAFVNDSLRGEFAEALLNAPPPPRAAPVKYRQWGEGLEHEAVMQMERACLLPVSVMGALNVRKMYAINASTIDINVDAPPLAMRRLMRQLIAAENGAAAAE